MTAADTLKGAYDRRAAAEYLACSTEQLRLYVAQGLIAPRHHGTKPVFLRADLDELLRTLPDVKAVSR